jgi:hypothetical protein
MIWHVSYREARVPTNNAEQPHLFAASKASLGKKKKK